MEALCTQCVHTTPGGSAEQSLLPPPPSTQTTDGCHFGPSVGCDKEPQVALVCVSQVTEEVEPFPTPVASPFCLPSLWRTLSYLVATT